MPLIGSIQAEGIPRKVTYNGIRAYFQAFEIPSSTLGSPLGIRSPTEPKMHQNPIYKRLSCLLGEEQIPQVVEKTEKDKKE
jgi:hypothetical protein